MPPTEPVVLVVDDEPDLADLYSGWLADEYTVRTVYGGADAVEALDETIDVVLLDRNMPTSGREVLDEIRTRELTCRVAMVTAVEPDFDIVEMGFDDYLVKPVQPAHLTATVARLLELATYDTVVQEYFALASKMAAVQASKTSEDLSESEKFTELESRFTQAKQEAQGQLETLFEADSFGEPFRRLLQECDDHATEMGERQ